MAEKYTETYIGNADAEMIPERTDRARRIIVMGGSFNPPTVAHKKLLLAAVDSLHADGGIFNG